MANIITYNRDDIPTLLFEKVNSKTHNTNTPYKTYTLV